jgi:hypothetical protein
MTPITLLLFYLSLCFMFGTLVSFMINDLIESSYSDDKIIARRQLVLLPLVWLFWPLLLAFILLCIPVVAAVAVYEVLRRAFPGK